MCRSLSYFHSIFASKAWNVSVGRILMFKESLNQFLLKIHSQFYRQILCVDTVATCWLNSWRGLAAGFARWYRIQHLCGNVVILIFSLEQIDECAGGSSRHHHSPRHYDIARCTKLSRLLSYVLVYINFKQIELKNPRSSVHLVINTTY